MTPQTVLIFAYHFPPEQEIGAARPARFYTYLTKLGYTCKIITAAPQESTALPGVTYLPDPYLQVKRLSLRWQLERALRRFLLPGAVGLGWSVDAYKKASELLKKEDLSRVTIMSTFPPMGVHFAAWQLARAFHVPWIADFRDPLAGYQMKHLSRIQARVCRFLERLFIRKASAVVANTDANQDDLQMKYPDRADRIHLIWNGFDPENRIPAKPLPKRGYKVLSHLGTLYAGRTVGPIVESVNRLIQTQRLRSDAVQIRLVGTAEPRTMGDSALIKRAQSQGWLELTVGGVPQSEARGIIQTSDYLLLIQQQSSMLVPGKLFEYLQVGRPILAFVTPNSATERILLESGVPYRCVYPEYTPERMDQVIAEFLNLPTESVPPSQWFEKNFNGATQTHALSSIIDNLTSRLS